MKTCFQLSGSEPLELLDDPKDEEILLNANIRYFPSDKDPNAKSTMPTSSKSTADPDEKIGIKSFQILKLLGAGAFGKVYLARLKSSNSLYALKVLRKRQIINRNQVKYAVAEVNILKKMNHPFIISLYFAFQVLFGMSRSLKPFVDPNAPVHGPRLLPWEGPVPAPDQSRAVLEGNGQILSVRGHSRH